MIIPIRYFGGMLTNPQGEDIPDFSSEWNVNVDPQTQSQLRGVDDSGASYTANGTAIPDATESRFIKYNASGTMKWDLVYLDKEDNDITVVEDFYNSQANRTFTDKVTSLNGNVSTIETFGNTAQIGTGNGSTEIPYVIYRLLQDRKFFNDALTASAGLFAHYGICDNQIANLTISGLTAASPIEATVTANHGLLTGQLVAATGSTPGFTGFIGVYTITVTADNKFTLDGSSGSGTWSSGGTIRSGYVAPESVALVGGSSPQYFQANILYSWGVSVIYDGLQESNLITIMQDGTAATASSGSVSQKADIQLRSYQQSGVFSDALYDKRITAVKIYRAESSDLSSANLGLYRLVRTVDINKGVDTYNWAASGVSYDLTYEDFGGYPEGGATYEEETGMLGTMERIFVHYDLNTTGGGYHWMAQPYVPAPSSTGGIPIPVDWDRYIFRSEKYRPNMVNWVEGNHLVLPEIPVDLKYYNNKLYVFTENWVYRINPELLIVEDAAEGFGVSVAGGVIATEYGMFFCNLNGAYVLRNDRIDTISDSIKMGLGNYTNDNWLRWAEDAISTPANLGRIIVGYLADKRCVVFIGQEPAAATTLAFVYYLPTTEWFMWDFSQNSTNQLDSNSGLVAGKDGELYWSGTTTLNKLLGGSTRETAEWVSKEFTLGEPSQDKFWRKGIADSATPTGSVTFKYDTEGSDPVSGTTLTSGSNINIYKKTFQVYLKTTLNATIDSFDIVLRKLIGER